jgi:A/G-specific adenine glycosylase
VEDRLISLREAACLQGFPIKYLLGCGSLCHGYRHVGDAVPPLISYQISGIVKWILTGKRPTVRTMVLPNTNLTAGDIVRVPPTKESNAEQSDQACIRAMRTALVAFYRTNGRYFLWRRRGFGHFRTLLAECLLQKTNATSVDRVLRSFLASFGTVEKLADAPLHKVEEAMNTLGLPARAGQMIKMAQCIRSQYGGRLPWTFKGLLGLPGVGVYTACAVRSFALGIPEGIVDSNVIRVLERVFGERSPGKWFRQKARHWLPHVRRLARSSLHREVNYALLDLGATVCRPGQPLCQKCPLKVVCKTGRKHLETMEKSNGA